MWITYIFFTINTHQRITWGKTIVTVQAVSDIFCKTTFWNRQVQYLHASLHYISEGLKYYVYSLWFISWCITLITYRKSFLFGHKCLGLRSQCPCILVTLLFCLIFLGTLFFVFSLSFSHLLSLSTPLPLGSRPSWPITRIDWPCRRRARRQERKREREKGPAGCNAQRQK